MLNSFFVDLIWSVDVEKNPGTCKIANLLKKKKKKFCFGGHHFQSTLSPVPSTLPTSMDFIRFVEEAKIFLYLLSDSGWA